MKLTEVQKSIVEAPLGPCIVTAGAGSGKTRVLTHRLAHIIVEKGIPDYAIVALTFTNKAAGEMKARVEKILQENSPLVKGVAAQRADGGFSCNAFLGTFHAWCARFLRRNIKPPFTSDFTIYDAKDSAKVFKEVGEGNVEAYKARLKSANALDFDDLLEMTYEILSSAPAIRESLQKSIQYILVDEFQDTDEVQYKIVQILANKHKNIMVVGDEDQCIFSWRGASIENLSAFRRDFPDAKIYKLEENFRSSSNIVSLANRLVSENVNRLDKVLFSNIRDGEIEIKQCSDEREEAQNIAAHIAYAHSHDGARYRDFAVLMRLDASNSIEEQFRTFNIPYIKWCGFKFYDRAEIKSVNNYLRILVNPLDQVAIADALNFPKRGIGEVSVKKILAGDIAGLSAKARKGYENYLYVLNQLREIHDSFGLFDLAGSFIAILGLDTLYGTGKDEDEGRLQNLYDHERAIKVFAENNPTATLTHFLQSVSLVQDADKTSLSDDTVIVSTIHSAKGLEFKNVFIIGLEDGLLPMSRAFESTDEMEEERRLLYVAITRACRSLHLSYCVSRYRKGKTMMNRPSRFLEECGFNTPSSPNGESTPLKRGESVGVFLCADSRKSDFINFACFLLLHLPFLPFFVLLKFL